MGLGRGGAIGMKGITEQNEQSKKPAVTSHGKRWRGHGREPAPLSRTSLIVRSVCWCLFSASIERLFRDRKDEPETRLEH